MPDLKLARLPDRTPVRIAITVSPELNRQLHAYAELYQQTYGAAESVSDLIPYILESFLDADRGFAKVRKEKLADVRPAAMVTVPRGRRHRAASDPTSTAS